MVSNLFLYGVTVQPGNCAMVATATVLISVVAYRSIAAIAGVCLAGFAYN